MRTKEEEKKKKRKKKKNLQVSWEFDHQPSLIKISMAITKFLRILVLRLDPK